MQIVPPLNPEHALQAQAGGMGVAGSSERGDSIDARIRAAQLEMCLGSTLQAQLVALVNAGLLYLFLRPVVDLTLLNLWLAALLGGVALRVMLYGRYRAVPPASRELAQWEGLNLLGVAISGLLWGATGLLLFTPHSLPHQVFLSFVIGGLAAGSVSTLSVQRHAALLFMLPALLPLVGRFLFAGHEFAWVMCGMLAVFLLMMLVASARFFANFRDTLAESLRREAAENDLAQIAYYDPLTELPNRRLFADFTQRASAGARRHGTLIAVCYLDLDDFKPINEGHGYELGDRVLVRAAEILRASVRAGDVVARWGGDEFAVLLTEIESPQACRQALQRLIERLAEPQMVDGVAVDLGASIGAALGPGDSDDPDILLRQADHAMYLAKRAGRSGYHLFDAELDGEDRRRSEARASMRDALNAGQLQLHVQPKVEMDSGRVYGAEALIRWQHPQRGLVPPGSFLPQWEADPAMIELDRWVVRSAFQQLDAWIDQGLRLALSVNVSAWLLHDTGFIPFLDSLVNAYPRTRGLLEIEVTETRALDDVGHISQVMSRSAALDVEFALDDFGTGFSSLVHLQRLPAHALKIDTTFVRAMLDSETDHNLVRGIVGLGHSLGKQVIAEGVETIAHGSALLALGCTRAQGYGIARPMPAAELPDWVALWQAPPEWLRPSPPALTGAAG